VLVHGLYSPSRCGLWPRCSGRKKVLNLSSSLLKDEEPEVYQQCVDVALSSLSIFALCLLFVVSVSMYVRKKQRSWTVLH